MKGTSPPAAPPDQEPAARVGGGIVVSLFSATLLVSAALAFMVQPMFARFALPLFGSTPAVWTTAMLFFQAALLAGYLYAHTTTARLGARRQAALHLGVVALGLAFLPIGVPGGFAPPAGANQVVWLLALLLLAVGLPFFVVSATAPLLQRWLAATQHPAASDPYFLYRASNLGSVLGLLAYPLALEPTLVLGDQSRAWGLGYGLLAVLVAGSAAVLWRSAPASAGEGVSATSFGALPGGGNPGASTLRRRMRWLALAFAPSSLMLGVTAFLSTDIAPVPLLWVAPLSLYLLSFILVFSPNRDRGSGRRGWVGAFAVAAVLTALTMLFEIQRPLWLIVALHLTLFFLAAMVCHGQLAADRPSAGRLTEFYLWLALGGALGGLFNAVVAPAAFEGLIEYPLALVLVALLMPGVRPSRQGTSSFWLDLGVPLALGAGVAACAFLAGLADAQEEELLRGFVFGLAAGLCLSLVRRPVRFGLALGAVLLAGAVPAAGETDTTLFAERTFFGMHRVLSSEQGGRHRLLHGTTTHGEQSFAGAVRPPEPLTYYGRTGPVGQLMAALPDPSVASRAAVLGLGTGTMSCYARPGQRWTFYEIDPTVRRIAQDPRLFTYLRDCPGRFDVVLGDARLSLRQAPAGGFGLIVGDAFSSDAIPVHLLTREAFALYLSKLKRGGALAFHISNRYLDLEPVLGDLARDHGLYCASQHYRVSAAEDAAGLSESRWVAMAQRPADLGLRGDARWHACGDRPGTAVWTDDFSNVVGALRWE